MARTAMQRRAGLLILLALGLITFAGLLVDEAAVCASNDHTRHALSTGCLHSGLVLPTIATLFAGLVPLLIWFVAPPARRGFRVSAPVRPPTSRLSPCLAGALTCERAASCAESRMAPLG